VEEIVGAEVEVGARLDSLFRAERGEDDARLVAERPRKLEQDGHA